MRNKKEDTLRRILFALSYAGGSSLSYMNWTFEEPIKWVPLDYPGHGLRMKEQVPDRIQDLAEDIAKQIDDYMKKQSDGTSFAIFAHSMGGVVAYHATQILQEQYGLKPDALFLSSSAPPTLFPPPLMRPQTDEELGKYLRDSIGLSEQTLQNERFRDMYIPMFRKDHELILAYQSDCIYQLDIPVYLFGAMGDELILPEYLPKWEELCVSAPKIEWFEGDHFYFNEPLNRVELCMKICTLWKEIRL